MPDTDQTTTPGLAAWIARGREMAAREDRARATARTRRFDTIAVHGLYDHLAAAANQGAIIEPAYLAPAQHFADSDELEAALGYLMPAWGYTRIANPTTHYLEETLALLEAYGTGLTAAAVVTGSGMAAVHLATNALLGGRPIPSRRDAQPRRLRQVLRRHVHAVRRGTPRSGGSVCAGSRIRSTPTRGRPRSTRTRASCTRRCRRTRRSRWRTSRRWRPSPTGTGSRCSSIRPSRRRRCLRPLGLGADVVIHSLSKAIGVDPGWRSPGRSSRATTSRSGWASDDLRADFATHLKLLPARDLGAALSPSSALALLSDLRTLRTRMDAWSRSTSRWPSSSRAHRAVARVWYPGLASHPGHTVAARDFSLADGDADGRPAARYGTLLAFTLRGGLPAAPEDVRPLGAHLPRDGPRPGEERRDHPVDLHAPAAGRGRPRHRPTSSPGSSVSPSAGSTRTT